MLGGVAGSLILIALSRRSATIGRWPETFSYVMMILGVLFAFLVAFTGNFSKAGIWGTPEQRTKGSSEFKTRMVVWLIAFVLALIFFKARDYFRTHP